MEANLARSFIVLVCVATFPSNSIGQEVRQNKDARASFIGFGGTAMGMQYDCQISDAIENDRLQLLQERTAAELKRLERIFSLYDPRSVLSSWNSSSSTEWAAVPAEVVELLDFAHKLHRETDGRFDPTIAPLSQLWRIGTVDLDWSPPTESQIREVKEYVGLHRIEWESSPPRLRKNHPRVAIDLNALVEGLALRNLSELFSELQVRNYLLHLGGEYLAKGMPRSNTEWIVYLEDPRHEAVGKGPTKLAFTVPLRQQTISTSGNYRAGKEYGGKRFSHFIDPQTGVASNDTPRCVSVVTADPIASDGWASALMLLEPRQAIHLAEKQSLAVCVSEGDGWVQSPQSIQTQCFQPVSALDMEAEDINLSLVASPASPWNWLQIAWFACLSLLLVVKISEFVRVSRR